MTGNLGQYGKLWTGIIGLALTVVTTKYAANTTWLPYVVAAASAAGIYGVPNVTKIPTMIMQPRMTTAACREHAEDFMAKWAVSQEPVVPGLQTSGPPPVVSSSEPRVPPATEPGIT